MIFAIRGTRISHATTTPREIAADAGRGPGPRRGAAEVPRITAIASNQEAALLRFLEDGRLKIDNNASERALRRIAIGRKNWLFVGSDDHAVATANLLSMIASAKLRDLDPEEYLRDVFRVLPHWPEDR